MATYTKVYNNPYPNGWKDGKDGKTPVTASILNNQTETLEAIEQYLEDNPITQGGGSGETGTTDYNDLTNKPSINGTELSGDITLDIPEKTSDLENDSGFLTNIKEQPYSDLGGKPTINGVEVVGDLTAEDLGLSGGGSGGTTDYEALNNLPSIENVELKGNVTLAELGTKKQIRISWADYQALPIEEKNDFSIVYLVYDYPENVIMASNVVYDNSESGIEATEVQGAIDELKEIIDNFNTIEYMQMENVKYVKSVSIVKGGNVCRVRINGTQEELTSNTDYDLCILPEKYRPTFNILKNIVLIAGSGGTFGYFYILSDGTIRIRPLGNIIANAGLYMDETYIVGGNLPT